MNEANSAVDPDLRDEVTAVLETLVTGSHGQTDDRTAFDRLVPLVYQELRRMAHLQMRHHGGLHTLDTTGLVHEAYVRLVQASDLPLRNRTYFFGAATRAMRNVLVDAARRRQAQKRGAGERPVTLDDEIARADAAATEILELDELLTCLSEAHPRPARTLECRVFGGLSVEETANTLGVSKRTADRDFTFARAWLRRELEGRSTGGA